MTSGNRDAANQAVDEALEGLRERLYKLVDEQSRIVVE